MTVTDIQAGMRLSTSAGWNQLEEDWRVFREVPGSGAFLAEKEGRAVGTAASPSARVRPTDSRPVIASTSSPDS